jgi:hypothetical protein
VGAAVGRFLRQYFRPDRQRGQPRAGGDRDVAADSVLIAAAVLISYVARILSAVVSSGMVKGHDLAASSLFQEDHGVLHRVVIQVCEDNPVTRRKTVVAGNEILQ